jgi:hypothetical protein
MGATSVIITLLCPVILYGVLQIGGEKKGWNYLE